MHKCGSLTYSLCDLLYYIFMLMLTRDTKVQEDKTAVQQDYYTIVDSYPVLLFKCRYYAKAKVNSNVHYRIFMTKMG